MHVHEEIGKAGSSRTVSGQFEDIWFELGITIRQKQVFTDSGDASGNDIFSELWLKILEVN